MPKLKYPEKVYLLLSQLYVANQGPTAAQRFIQENEGVEIPITTISSIYRRFKNYLVRPQLQIQIAPANLEDQNVG